MPIKERYIKMAQVKPTTKKKLSGPCIAAIIVCAAILLGLVASLVASTGIFFRMQKGASSENFSINGSMMEYYTNSIYQSWYSQYYYYILLGYVSFNPNTPLDEQYTDSTKTQTYYDYFTEQATVQLTKLLKYCEAARVDEEIDFPTLEKEAQDYADETIQSLKDTAKKSNIDFTTFLRQNFGEHVNKNDLHEALVIEYIASDFSNTMYDRIYDAMTDERKEEYFKDNLSSFISADYLTFTLSNTVTAEKVDESKYEGGKDSQEYKDAVAKAEAEAKKQNDLNKVSAKEFIDKLATAKDAEEFKRFLLEYKYEENFKSAYDTAIKNFADSDKPSDDDYKKFMAEVKDQIIDAVIDGKADIYEKTEGETDTNASVTKWESAKKTLPASVITKLKSVITSATKTASFYADKTAFEKNTDLNKFLFAGVKAQYGVKYEDFETEGENAEVNDYLLDIENYDDEKADATKKAIGAYSYTVYFVTESAHRDEQVLRDVGHILFKVDKNDDDCYASFEEAEKQAKLIYEEILATAKDGVVEKEVFEEFGNKYTNDSGVFYENVNKGQMVEEFEEWLFAATKEGEIGLVKTESYGWHIMYYGGETDVAWRVNAHSAATSADLTEWYEKLPFEVSINTELYKNILG